MKAKNDQLKLSQEMEFSQQQFEQQKELMILEHNIKIAEARAKAEAAKLNSQNLMQKAQHQAFRLKMEASA
jgi:hypothetical protein